MNTLVLDIGGTNVKMLVTDQEQPRKFHSGPKLTPEEMVVGVKRETADWQYDRVSIGLPTPIVHGKPVHEPNNLGSGWVNFDFPAAFGKPVRLINDAAMQALGSYDGGRMLFLGLGTGLGSCLIIDGTIAPLELAHLPYRKEKTFEDYVGQRGYDHLGQKKWQRRVEDVVARLKAAVGADYVVLGGGNIKNLQGFPPGARPGDNRNAFTGGFRLWEDAHSKASPYMVHDAPTGDANTTTSPTS
jgi:polyphosphate glucokinase